MTGHDDEGGRDPAGRIAGKEPDAIPVGEDPVGEDQGRGIGREDLPCPPQVRCNGDPEPAGIAPETAEDQVLVGTVVFNNEDVERTCLRCRFTFGGRT
jgi:hypothetical protein